MKNKKMVACLSSLLVISLLTTGCGKEIEVKNGSKVAVSVKGNKITATEYYQKIKESNITELIDMIDKDLLNKDYPETEDEKKDVDKQIEQIRSYYSDDETFNQVIKQYFGVDNEKDLRTVLGMEYKRNQAAKDYIKKNIKDNEVKKYYEENITGDIKASHILISVNVNSDASDEEKENAEKEAKEKAEKLIKELDNGKKFADLAKKNSDDKASATNGGDLGYFSPDEMVKEFSDAAKELKVKEYTKEPVKTEYGYHIILKTGEKEKPALKDVKKDIKEKITTNKLNDDPSLYYEALKGYREDKKLSWNDDVLKKAYNDYMNKLIENSKKQETNE